MSGAGARPTDAMSGNAARAPLAILTSLRFFAAAEVVVFHGLPHQIRNDFLHGFGSAGYQAVTFFFVLSGFILTYVYTGSSERDGLNVPAREFWQARVARIMPAYFLGLLLLLPPYVYSALIAKIVALPTFIAGLVLVPMLQQAWWAPAAVAWNGPAWSLSVEFFFYAGFPALTLAAARLPRHYFIVLAYALVIAVAVLRYAVWSSGVAFESAEQNFGAYFPLLHWPQFIFGMALGRIFLFGPAFSSRQHAVMLCLGSLALALALFEPSPLPAWARTDATLAPLFGLVIFGAARAQGACKVLAAPALVLLGEASYSIYILHAPVSWWWAWCTRDLALPAIPGFLIYFALVIAASILTYRYVERPLRRRILGHREHRTA